MENRPLDAVLTVMGFAAYGVIGFFVAASGLMAPLWAVIALGTVWVVGLAVMIRNRSSLAIVLAVPLVMAGVWVATMWAGGEFLDWTA